MIPSSHDALTELGLAPGDRVRFRRRESERWKPAVVVRREADGSVGLRDGRGAARAIPIDAIEVRVTGPRGGVGWEPLPERAARTEQLRLLVTIEVYEERAQEWEQARAPRRVDDAAAFAARTGDRGVVVDLGCGPGWYAPALAGSGARVVALDAARAMLELVPAHAPGALRVQADLAALPFRTGGLVGAWGSKCYVHLARADVPLALRDLQRSLPVGAPVELHLFDGDLEHGPLFEDDFPGRLFSRWPPDLLSDVITAAGFAIERVDTIASNDGVHMVKVQATRARTLADTVGAGMRLLVSGLNPSVYSADVGAAFARPGNRFWPAALAAGLATRDRDPFDALVNHGMGMTDIVKRATPRADELTTEEYAAGIARLERLVAWLAPRAVVFVGLAGWRAAVDRKAQAGVQPGALAGVPVYLMPSTSGANAHAQVDVLTEHLRAAARLADL